MKLTRIKKNANERRLAGSQLARPAEAEPGDRAPVLCEPEA